MKKKANLLLVLFTCLIVSILLQLYGESNKTLLDNQYQYKLNYSYAGYYYEIYSYKTYFVVSKNKPIKCEKVKCDPALIKTYRVDFKKKALDKVNNFMDMIFSRTESNEINGLEDYDLTNNESLLVRGIINGNEKIFKNKNYTYDTFEVISEDYYSSYKNKGYHINDDGTITISMGTRNTGGFYLSVLKATIVDGKLSLFVMENGPGDGDVVTQAFTAPAITVRIKGTYNDVVVHDTYSNIWNEI